MTDYELINNDRMIFVVSTFVRVYLFVQMQKFISILDISLFKEIKT